MRKQDIRNALYQGKATNLLNKLAKSYEFQEATVNGVSSHRMKDKYIILGAIAFYLWNEETLKDEK